MLWWMNSPVMKNWQPSGEKKSAAPKIFSKHGLIFAQTAASNPSKTWTDLSPTTASNLFKTWTDLLWKQQPRIPLKHGLISFENSSPESPLNTVWFSLKTVARSSPPSENRSLTFPQPDWSLLFSLKITASLVLSPPVNRVSFSFSFLFLPL